MNRIRMQLHEVVESEFYRVQVENRRFAYSTYAPALREYSCSAKVLARPWPWAGRAHGGAP